MQVFASNVICNVQQESGQQLVPKLRQESLERTGSQACIAGTGAGDTGRGLSGTAARACVTGTAWMVLCSSFSMTAMCPVLSFITCLKSRGGQFSTFSTSALVLCEVEGDLCTAGAAGSTGPVAVAVGDVGIGTAGAGTGLFGDCGAVEAQNQALELRPFPTSKTLRCSQRGESSAAAAMEGGRPCINLVSPVCNKYPSLNVFLRRKASKACTCEACVRVIRLDAGIPVTTRSDVEDRRCGPAGTALPGQRKPT